MEKSRKIASLYVATLKAIALVHQMNHWKSKGDAFYGDHLLFERIYNSALKDLDLAAEKFVGLLGSEVLAYQAQNELMNKVLSKFNELEEKPAAQSLAIEKQFLKLSLEAYNFFEEEGELTLGMDDMIMAIASSREEAVYLLQQKLKEHQ